MAHRSVGVRNARGVMECRRCGATGRGAGHRRRRRGLAADYEAETVWYTTPHFSRVDWRIRTASGRTVLVETKGYFPPEDRTKVARIVESNPDLDYRLLFQTGSGGAKIGPAWCRKRGIKFAIGMIPDAWYQE